MNRALVVVFDGEEKAYEGRKALRQLDAEGSVQVYAAVVVARAADGSAAVKKEDGGPLGTVLGTSLGGLIGLLGGPAGAAIGAVAGMGLGLIGDLETSRIGTDFVEDVQAALTPGKAALIADVDEEWTERVDDRMEALGGTVYRRSLSDVRDTANDEDDAAIKAEIAQLKAEHAQARTEHKAKLRDRLPIASVPPIGGTPLRPRPARRASAGSRRPSPSSPSFSSSSGSRPSLSRPADTNSTAAAARSPAPFDTSRPRSILAGGFKIFCLRL